MTYREGIEAMRRQWRDRKVVYEGAIYTVLDVDYNGSLLIDKPAEFTATTAVSVGMVKLLDGADEAGGGAPMNPFAKAIRQQLLEYQQQLAPDKSYAIVSAQIKGYKIGLETCLNRSFVAMMFYDVFGDQVF